MRLLLLFILTVNILSCHSQEVLICPPRRNTGSIILYNDEAIKKGKFNEKYISTDPASPLGVPVVIGDVILKGKDLIQILYINGKRVAMYFPKTMKSKNINRGNLSYALYEREYAFSGGRTDPKRQSYPYFSTYPYDEYTQLNSLKDSTLYYIGNGNYYGHPYKIKSLDFSGGDYYNWEVFRFLRLKFNTGKEIFLLPNGYKQQNARYDNNALSLRAILDNYITESQFIDSCRSHYSEEFIADFSNKFLGQEIYLSSEVELIESNEYISLKQFCKVDSISFTRAFNSKPTPLFAYYVHLTSSDNSGMHYVIYLPPNGLKGIEFASEKRQRDEAQRMEEVQRQRQQELDDEREIQEMEDAYARKYGRSNAKLIMDGEVRLGWSKQMCIESWGEPSDRTRVTTQIGTAEAWWYSGGYILYFRGNKLVMIQD